jgi:hypothetical protein
MMTASPRSPTRPLSWPQPSVAAQWPTPCVAANDLPELAVGARALYEVLMDANGEPEGELRLRAQAFLERWRTEVRTAPSDLPEGPAGLASWLQANLAGTGDRYKAYLAERKTGAPRRYFSTRAHALHFLRAVAPTKLVDGSWLYGLMKDSANPQLSDLLFTYIEELGDGDADKNHVLLYRRLLDAQGIVDWADQPDAHYVQGALQLALAACADDFLPEVIGFNLGYEQLPLHLLITAYELDQLGIDPTYFQLHVTVDNAAGGHAQRALRAAATAWPSLADRDAFWARLEDGYRLSSAGWGTVDAIQSYDAQTELVRVLDQRAREGKAAHSDYCRLEGKTVNEWLGSPGSTAAFVQALQRKGWLTRNSDPAASRFWQLLQGDAAEMFGVFGDYELQLIYDWIRGDAATDGAAFVRGAGPASAPVPPRSFRQVRRLTQKAPPVALADLAADVPLDPDLQVLRAALADDDRHARGVLLRRLLGPAFHWRPAGLEATRLVSNMMRATN